VLRVPFFLEPHYDENKPFIESNRERLVAKWGGQAGWERQKKAHDLKGRGMEAGIPHFNLDRLTSNTMASHRLIQHIGKLFGLHASEALYDRLNVYYFVDGQALNDRPRVAQVAAEELLKHGYKMSEEEILKFLESNQGRKEIERTLEALNELGIHSIPKFVVEGHTVIDGAAHWRHHVEVFREIERRGSTRGGPVFGKLLGVSEDIVAQGSHERVLKAA